MTNINYEAMDDEETFVPHHMRGAYQRWIENGLGAGGFGMALITGDLGAAIARADMTNAKHILSSFNWFKQHAPSGSFGSAEKADCWVGTKAGKQSSN